MIEMDQGVLQFREQGTPLPDHPLVVLHWTPEGIHAEWPEFGIRARFATWTTALACVCHPLNDHIRVKVRP